ncbi:signaling lymphocytic activation molecule isoform X2 [Callorhinus ursinus]|uniref:Signaling lymphocytic activation molecule isoform X2 n=1 Tax=Callorhinus ursinus TaxID=34884 RepID=A0A3Q7N8M7_CALUR|nr:signaling lymphocytic activation molecule isoform X2 [Callorhinus ursinus]
MDPKGLLSLNFLLFLSLAFELSCGTGESLMNCPEIPGRLGSSLLLSLASEGVSKSMNKSIHILVTRAESPRNSVKKKIASLDLPEGGSPRYLENGYTFHLENLSLGILESRKENEGWYFMTLEENFSVRHFCLQLKLYEQVSTPEIKVLNWTQENGNCSLTLACEVEKGDYVVYSWSEEMATDPLIPANGSHLLHLRLGPQNVNNVYFCTASNPISSRSQTFTPQSKCRPESLESTQWGLYAGLFLGGIVGVILILEVVILLLRRRGRCLPIKRFISDSVLPPDQDRPLGCFPQVKQIITSQQWKQKALLFMPKSRNQVLFRRNLIPCQLRTPAPPFTLLPQNLSQSLSRNQIPSQSMPV